MSYYQEKTHRHHQKIHFGLPKSTIVYANHSSRGSDITLSDLPVGYYHIVPDSASRWTLASGELETDFRGLDDTMNPKEIGIDLDVPIPIGCLVLFFDVTATDTNPAGTTIEFWDKQHSHPFIFQVFEERPGGLKYPQPIKAQFVIADRHGAYGDNDGTCKVDVLSGLS